MEPAGFEGLAGLVGSGIGVVGVGGTSLDSGSDSGMIRMGGGVALSVLGERLRSFWEAGVVWCLWEWLRSFWGSWCGVLPRWFWWWWRRDYIVLGGLYG